MKNVFRKIYESCCLYFVTSYRSGATNINFIFDNIRKHGGHHSITILIFQHNYRFSLFSLIYPSVKFIREPLDFFLLVIQRSSCAKWAAVCAKVLRKATGEIRASCFHTGVRRVFGSTAHGSRRPSVVISGVTSGAKKQNGKKNKNRNRFEKKTKKPYEKRKQRIIPRGHDDVRVKWGCSTGACVTAMSAFARSPRRFPHRKQQQ